MFNSSRTLRPSRVVAARKTRRTNVVRPGSGGEPTARREDKQGRDNHSNDGEEGGLWQERRSVWGGEEEKIGTTMTLTWTQRGDGVTDRRFFFPMRQSGFVFRASAKRRAKASWTIVCYLLKKVVGTVLHSQ